MNYLPARLRGAKKQDSREETYSITSLNCWVFMTIHILFLISGVTPIHFLMNLIIKANGWCTGTTQRDGMGREEGGGFRMGNTCVPVADSF